MWQLDSGSRSAASPSVVYKPKCRNSSLRRCPLSSTHRLPVAHSPVAVVLARCQGGLGCKGRKRGTHLSSLASEDESCFGERLCSTAGKAAVRKLLAACAVFVPVVIEWNF